MPLQQLTTEEKRIRTVLIVIFTSVMFAASVLLGLDRIFDELFPNIPHAGFAFLAFWNLLYIAQRLFTLWWPKHEK